LARRATSRALPAIALARAAAPLAALAAVAWLALPRGAASYSTIGGSLSLAERHLRVYDNFTAPGANANTTPSPEFPGVTGVELAVWKAAVEWSSELHGSGTGDPHQFAGLGSGGANFDPSWQGNAPAIGTTNDNVVSQIAGSDHGVLAYCETPISDGWRIRMYETWDWDDGPGTSLPAAAVDVQGVVTHEYGHALGLGHSGSLGATMYPTLAGNGVSQRSIAADDTAGVQAIYGAKSASKPRITGTEVSAGTLTLSGHGFAASGLEIWFTRAASGGGSNGAPVKVGGAVSTDGGTRVSAAIPAAAGPGDVLVCNPGGGHADLSNAWPLDPAVEGASGGPPVIAGLAPASVPCIEPGPTIVTASGSSLATVESVSVGGIALQASQFDSAPGGTLAFEVPTLETLGAVPVVFGNAAGEGAPAMLEITAPDPPTLECASPYAFSSAPLTLRAGAVPGRLLWIAASTELAPTSVPGIVELALGAGGSALAVLPCGVVPARGWSQLDLALAGLPFGTGIHFQAAVLDPQVMGLPLAVSPPASATFYF
jgi:hypothetical protein